MSSPAAISHVERTFGQTAKLATWLFLASEAMFFAGLLGAYVILRGAAPGLFQQHAAALDRPLAVLNTIVLLVSSVTMTLAVRAIRHGAHPRGVVLLALTLVGGLTFTGIKSHEWQTKLAHYTVVAVDSQTRTSHVYDGALKARSSETLTLVGQRIALPDAFDIHSFLAEESPLRHAPEEWTLRYDSINQQVSLGPWKNTFYASYFTLTGVHVLHMLGGMVAIAVLLAQGLRRTARGATAECIGIYWNFVDGVWLVLFAVLYLA